MIEYIDLTTRLRVHGEHKDIAIENISNMGFSNLKKNHAENNVLNNPLLTPIVLSENQETFEIIADDVFWLSESSKFKYSHLKCFIIDDKKLSALELQDLKSLCEFYIPATHDPESCERLIEEYYTNNYFKGLIQRFFFSGSSLTDKDLFSLLGAWGKKIRTLQRRKDEYGAVTHRKDKVESLDVASQKQPLSADINKELQESSEQTNSDVSAQSDLNPPAPLKASENSEMIAPDSARNPIKQEINLNSVSNNAVDFRQETHVTMHSSEAYQSEAINTTIDLPPDQPRGPSIQDKWNAFAITQNIPEFNNARCVLRGKSDAFMEFNLLINKDNLQGALELYNRHLNG